jgi:two-component system, NarL family, invasion response regulator UvrY
MATILLADDHPMVLAGLRQLLREDRTVTEIGQASSGNETLERLAGGRWDLLILDINMPDCSGLKFLSDIRTRHPDTKVLVLSAFSERQYAIPALKAGACGYLPKECAPRDLLVAVRTVLQGRRYVSSQMADVLVSELGDHGGQPMHCRLSEREFQIFCKLAVGRTVSWISNELCLSVKTVSTYRARVLEKMNFATNADITRYALTNEII